MADNYLEKKYEQFKNGPTVIRKVNPSLDTLLHRIAGETAAEPMGTAANSIKQAQLDAIVRSASILGYTFRFETSEEKGSVYILGPNAPHSKAVELGEIILAMRLKAAELGFRTEVGIVRELLRAPQPHLATLNFFRI